MTNTVNTSRGANANRDLDVIRTESRSCHNLSVDWVEELRAAEESKTRVQAEQREQEKLRARQSEEAAASVVLPAAEEFKAGLERLNKIVEIRTDGNKVVVRAPDAIAISLAATGPVDRCRVCPSVMHHGRGYESAGSIPTSVRDRCTKEDVLRYLIQVYKMLADK